MGVRQSRPAPRGSSDQQHPDAAEPATSSAARTGRRVGLQTRWTLVVVACALAGAVPLWWLVLQSTARLTGRLQSEQCVQAAAMLARAAAPLVRDRDIAALERLVSNQVGYESFRLMHVCFTDASGVVLAAGNVRNAPDALRVRPPSESATDPPTDPNATSATSILRTAVVGIPEYHPARGSAPPYFDVVYPIVSPGPPGSHDSQKARCVGYVRLALNLGPTLRELEAATNLISGVGIGMVLLSIPLGFVLVRRVVGPLGELMRAMRRFADGDLEARPAIDPRRGDEIGGLAVAFNDMADRHARTHAQIVALNADLEQRVRARTRQLRELACRDPLTGLYNRRYFNEVLVQLLAESRRYGSDLACIMIDLDNFKAVNDIHGHRAGDEVLRDAADVITRGLRSADLAARFGGDEFVVLLPHTSAAQARILGERIAEAFSERMRAGDSYLPKRQVTLSVGIGGIHDIGFSDDADGQALVAAADRALYDAKARGKNQVAYARTAR